MDAAFSAEQLNGKWQVCSPEVMGANWAWHGISAIGYYFAREIRQITHQPVGLIASYKGANGGGGVDQHREFEKSAGTRALRLGTR